MAQSRVVTLTGPGGVGKTRLALRVAQGLRRDFRDGVWFVELAALSDPLLLTHTVAEELGLRDQSARPTIETITEHLASHSALLVLDNCEHLVDDCARFTDTLIRSCPRVRVLATSRQSLGVYGETVLVVPPLPAPDPDGSHSPEELASYDSVRLFVERSRAVQPAFDVTADNRVALARLCRELDGLPLAIELTTTWLRTLSLHQIEERLAERYRLLTTGPRGAPPRQRTLRGLIDWSHELCSPAEQRVWARASVFAGSFDLAALEHVVVGDDVPVADIAELVHSLVDKSIVLCDTEERTARYRMLETLRQYGQEQLVAAGEDLTVRRRHRDWYQNLAESFDAAWIGPDQRDWIHRLSLDHANLRVALTFSVSHSGEGARALRMASRLKDYWGIRGVSTEARYWLDQALAASPEPSLERVSALCQNAWYALLQGDIAVALPLLTEADRLTERLGADGRTSYVGLVQGMVLLFKGDLEQATARLESALTDRHTMDTRNTLFALAMLGLAVGLQGEREKGLLLLEECLVLAAELGEQYWRSWALWALCFLETDHDPERAEEAGREALGIHGPMQGRLGTACVLETLAWVSERQQRHVRSATLFGAAATVWRELGSAPEYYAPVGAAHEVHVTLARAALGDDRFEAAFERGRGLTTPRAVEYALEARPATPTPAPSASPLTRREEEIATLLAEGMSNKDIAARLIIAPRTVETHVAHILGKLELTSRAEVAAWRVARQHSPAPAD
ncbi:ATP-binding protein [Streptomyces sp. NPDC057193]|uniref:ATP-binding protein n=1 Tax=Streptomyces sp. NPDC057193 TaxID=3346043 RepID=UPI00362C7A62